MWVVGGVTKGTKVLRWLALQGSPQAGRWSAGCSQYNQGETDGDNTVILEGDLKPGELVITDLALKTGAK